MRREQPVLATGAPAAQGAASTTSATAGGHQGELNLVPAKVSMG